jgi:hypothetical protein
MSNQKLKENQSPISTQELLKKAKSALTPEQYARMEQRVSEKIDTMKLITMNLDELKAELPKIVAWDHEEADIMDRLEREFPGVKPTWTVTKKTELGLWDSTKKKVSKIGDWIYDKLPWTDWKNAREIAKKWASASAVVATAALWTSAGSAVQAVEKALSWLDNLKKDPIVWFKELFNVLLSFDSKKISAFFSSNMDALGVSTDMVESFVEKMWFPKELIKTAKTILSDEKLGKMSYGSVEKVWQEYKKNPSLDIIKKLWVLWGKESDVVPIFEQIFSKNSKSIVEWITQKGNNKIDIVNLPMSNVIKYIAW